jgi:hypothetical protein
MKKVSLILAVIACYISCKQSIDLNTFPQDNHEYTGLTNFHNDPSINILESKKAGGRIFSIYQKNTLTGLISALNDSVVFVNDAFFSTGNAEQQSLDFIDSNRIMLKTINCKYIFRRDEYSDNWLLNYAEKKVSDDEQTVYLFTDNFPQNIAMSDFSADKTFASLLATVNDNILQYKYRKNNYRDSIEIQVHNMRMANAISFENIFTVEHAEEILNDYPLNKANVTFLNNVAYHLERMSITMPAIDILETIIDEYPDRIVAYLNLYNALLKNGLKVKAKKVYNQYTALKNKQRYTQK